MIFLVSSGKMIFLFPENMMLFFRRKMKDDLSQKKYIEIRYILRMFRKVGLSKKIALEYHFTETHRKTSDFDMYFLNFTSTCLFCFIQKIIYDLKRNWPRFSFPKFCPSSIYVITIVKFSNSPIQNVFSFPQ